MPLDPFVTVLLFALLPALGNLGGGLLAEVMDVSGKTLSLALHVAAGVVLAIVAVELMPEALAEAPPWLIVLAFVVGGLFFVAIDVGTSFVAERMGGTEAEAGPWVLFLGVAMDLFSDGIMIGAGSSVNLGLGLLLALGQVPADVPEGFATVATFKDKGLPRSQRILASIGFAVPVLLGATIGWFLLQGRPVAWKMALLAFTAGVLTTLVVEEIGPEAHEGETARFAAVAFIGGFALFSLLTVFFG